MLYPDEITEIISDCAFWADRLIRSELISGYISTENDYTSNFTAALRREINSRDIPGLSAISKVLDPSAERKYGADGCVILQSSKDFKASVFEAKWPRLNTHINYWDSQNRQKISRFHSQLERQSKYKSALAIWEMFYCESAFGTKTDWFPSHGSACVWHDDAYSVTKARTDNSIPWSDIELLALLKSSHLSIYQIFKSICECKEGRAYPLASLHAMYGEFGLPRKATIIAFDEEVEATEK